MLARGSLLFLAAAWIVLGGCGPDQQAIQRAGVHHGLGMNYLQQGDPTSALREFLEAEKLNPDDPQIQHALGLALNAKGRHLDAVEHYRKALALDPKYTEVHNHLGATYLELGRWDDAIKEFNVVLKDILYLTPFYVLNNLGWAYYRKGDFREAIENYRRALRMKPDFGLAQYNLGLAYRDKGETENALEAFARTVTVAPQFLDAHFQMGRIYLDLGKKQEAERSFQEVVRLAPRSENARLAREYLDLLKKPGK